MTAVAAGDAPLRVLVADDEAIARKRGLVRLLAAMPDIVIDGGVRRRARSARDGCAGAPSTWCLLDIQMPELNGLEALQLFPVDNQSAVIFCTAHEARAIAAFDVGAIDYLLKPVEAARLRRALDRARGRDSRDRHRDELARLQARDVTETPFAAPGASRRSRGSRLSIRPR